MFSRPVSDEALIERLLPACTPDRGERARAWEEWQATAEPLLRRYIGARNTTREADEDIVQDALLTAYLGVESGRYYPRAGVPFAAYVFGIARNKIREARRRDRRVVDLLEEDDGPDDSSRWERVLAREEPPVARPPELDLERRERSDLLRRGLHTLPAVRRGVLELTLAGVSTGEIADRMAISAELVRQHKCRGLRALQAQLAGYATAV